MLKLNVYNFREVLEKASVSYLIPSINLKINKEKATSALISPDNNVISFYSGSNNFLDLGTDENLEFNFSDISINLKPFLDTIKSNIVDVDIQENKLVVKDGKRKIELFFCNVEFTNNFSGSDVSGKFTPFYSNKANLINQFNEIKKIASKYNKLYLTCKGGKLFLESTDKLNSFANSLNTEVDDVGIDKSLDFTMCYDLRNFSSIISTIEPNLDDFNLKCIFLKENNAGMIIFHNNDSSEKYFITSKIE